MILRCQLYAELSIIYLLAVGAMRDDIVT